MPAEKSDTQSAAAAGDQVMPLLYSIAASDPRPFSAADAAAPFINNVLRDYVKAPRERALKTPENSGERAQIAVEVHGAEIVLTGAEQELDDYIEALYVMGGRDRVNKMGKDLVSALQVEAAKLRSGRRALAIALDKMAQSGSPGDGGALDKLDAKLALVASAVETLNVQLKTLDEELTALLIRFEAEADAELKLIFSQGRALIAKERDAHGLASDQAPLRTWSLPENKLNQDILDKLRELAPWRETMQQAQANAAKYDELLAHPWELVGSGVDDEEKNAAKDLIKRYGAASKEASQRRAFAQEIYLNKRNALVAAHPIAHLFAELVNADDDLGRIAVLMQFRSEASLDGMEEISNTIAPPFDGSSAIFSFGASADERAAAHAAAAKLSVWDSSQLIARTAQRMGYAPGTVAYRMVRDVRQQIAARRSRTELVVNGISMLAAFAAPFTGGATLIITGAISAIDAADALQEYVLKKALLFAQVTPDLRLLDDEPAALPLLIRLGFDLTDILGAAKALRALTVLSIESQTLEYWLERTASNQLIHREVSRAERDVARKLLATLDAAALTAPEKTRGILAKMKAALGKRASQSERSAASKAARTNAARAEDELGQLLKPGTVESDLVRELVSRQVAASSSGAGAVIANFTNEDWNKLTKLMLRDASTSMKRFGGSVAALQGMLFELYFERSPYMKDVLARARDRLLKVPGEWEEVEYTFDVWTSATRDQKGVLQFQLSAGTDFFVYVRGKGKSEGRTLLLAAGELKADAHGNLVRIPPPDPVDLIGRTPSLVRDFGGNQGQLYLISERLKLGGKARLGKWEVPAYTIEVQKPHADIPDAVYSTEFIAGLTTPFSEAERLDLATLQKLKVTEIVVERSAQDFRNAAQEILYALEKAPKRTTPVAPDVLNATAASFVTNAARAAANAEK